MYFDREINDRKICKNVPKHIQSEFKIQIVQNIEITILEKWKDEIFKLLQKNEGLIN